MSVARLKLEIQVDGQTLYSLNQTTAETEMGWQAYQIATATTDQAIAFNLSTGITTIDILYMASDQALTYKINGSATACTLDANGVVVLWGTAITALTVSNASGSTANFKILIGG